MNISPATLATLMATYITENAPVSYEQLRLRAENHKIPMGVFSNAMVIIHRSKLIEQVAKGDDIVYKVKVPEKEQTAPTHTLWVSQNYPRPENFVMPFPEIDMSYLFLKPDEMKEYKAQAKGMPMHMMFKPRRA